MVIGLVGSLKEGQKIEIIGGSASREVATINRISFSSSSKYHQGKDALVLYSY